jgi:hypothetical protein
MRSVVGPGTGSAQSKYSGRVSTQKYIVLNSSGRHAILAPRSAAWRTRRSAVSTLAALSAWPMNCTPAIRTMVWISRSRSLSEKASSSERLG